jgi:hypothetical protein
MACPEQTCSSDEVGMMEKQDIMTVEGSLGVICNGGAISLNNGGIQSFPVSEGSWGLVLLLVWVNFAIIVLEVSRGFVGTVGWRSRSTTVLFLLLCACGMGATSSIFLDWVTKLVAIRGAEKLERILWELGSTWVGGLIGGSVLSTSLLAFNSYVHRLVCGPLLCPFLNLGDIFQRW